MPGSGGPAPAAHEKIQKHMTDRHRIALSAAASAEPAGFIKKEVL